MLAPRMALIVETVHVLPPHGTQDGCGPHAYHCKLFNEWRMVYGVRGWICLATSWDTLVLTSITFMQCSLTGSFRKEDVPCPMARVGCEAVLYSYCSGTLASCQVFDYMSVEGQALRRLSLCLSLDLGRSSAILM
jgi:hypothetical protein